MGWSRDWNNQKGGNTKSVIMDLSGQRFSNLTVIRKSEQKYRTAFLWECKCDCGKICLVQQGALRSGNIKSCGCQYRKHGMTDTLIYKVWQMMKDRCYNPKSKSFHRYGGRGISVYDEWRRSSASFIKWALENGYARGLAIDRKDNNGNYEPGNCRFVTVSENNRNTRRTKLSPDQVIDIKSMVHSGIPDQEIAERFAVEKHVIKEIRRNKTWKDIPWPSGSIS